MTREEQFETMLADVLRNYDDTLLQMERMKAEGRTKCVTYRELLAHKLLLQQVMSIYRRYGLLD